MYYGAYQIKIACFIDYGLIADLSIAGLDKPFVEDYYKLIGLDFFTYTKRIYSIDSKSYEGKGLNVKAFLWVLDFRRQSPELIRDLMSGAKGAMIVLDSTKHNYQRKLARLTRGVIAKNRGDIPTIIVLKIPHSALKIARDKIFQLIGLVKEVYEESDNRIGIYFYSSEDVNGIKEGLNELIDLIMELEVKKN